MPTNDIQFTKDEVVHLKSRGYEKGEYVGGTQVLGPMGELEYNFRELYEYRKTVRSHEVSVTDLSTGNIVDLDYRKASNEVNTPYRIVQFHKGVQSRQKIYDATERDFVMVLEPVIQNASLVLVSGFIRRYDDGNVMSVCQNVFYKRRWDSPYVESLPDAFWKPSVFYDLGFEHKQDRSLQQFHLLFDELVAQTVECEENIFALIV